MLLLAAPWESAAPVAMLELELPCESAPIPIATLWLVTPLALAPTPQAKLNSELFALAPPPCCGSLPSPLPPQMNWDG